MTKISQQPKPQTSIFFSSLLPTPPQTFSHFPSLPLELRILIWSLCLPGPRRLSIFQLTDTHCRSQFSTHKPIRYRSFHTNPTLLYVNHESRTQTLKQYSMIYASHGFALAFNPRLDIIQIYSGPRNSALDPGIFMRTPFSSRGACARLKKIAIDDSHLAALFAADGEDASIMRDLGMLWTSFDEISILLSPAKSFRLLTKEKFRVLEYGRILRAEEGWGDCRCLSWLLRSLEMAGEKMVSDPLLLEKYNSRVGSMDRMVLGHLPVVKVVQWGMEASSKEDPWCVPLTGLSRRGYC